MSSGLGEMELELRLVPGVVNVGFGSLEEMGHSDVAVVAHGGGAELERTVTRIARSHRPAATVQVIDLLPSAKLHQRQAFELDLFDERVALVTTHIDVSGQAAVALSWKGTMASATSQAGMLIGPARATLEALQGLGVAIDAEISSVSTGRGVTNSPVRVILRSTQGHEEFVGIAQASSAPESSARATLAAFNRYVGGRNVQLN